ncbi:MAG: aldolase [Alphaproteobacteria bacterium]
MAEDIQEVRRDLAATFRWADRLGLNEGISNHFSYAVADDRFLINGWGWHWSEITASSLLLCDGEGRVVDGPESGVGSTVELTSLFIHARVHQGAPAARALFHTHMPYATAIASVKGGRLIMASQNALRFYGQCAHDDAYAGLALANDEGDRLCRAMAGRRILFMANHGVLVAGRTIAQGFDDLYYLEQAAKVQVLAAATGQPLRELDQATCEATASQLDYERENAFFHLAAIRRVLDREGSDYAH